VCSAAGGRACPGLSSFFRLGPRSTGSAAVGRRAEALRPGATKPPARYISKIVFSVVFALFATGTPTKGARIHEKRRCPTTSGPAPARRCHRPHGRDVPQPGRAIRPRDGDEEGHPGSSDRSCRPATDPARTGDCTAVSTVRGPPTHRTRAMRVTRLAADDASRQDKRGRCTGWPLPTAPGPVGGRRAAGTGPGPRSHSRAAPRRSSSAGTSSSAPSRPGRWGHRRL
jgi:hypothetical protein